MHLISARLAELRRAHYGERGRSRFARDLGIPITTYVHYETDRVPPAELLVHAARLTETRLEWLLGGEGERNLPPQGPVLTQAEQIAEELTKVLSTAPYLADSAREFVQLLQKMKQDSDRPIPVWTRPQSLERRETLIPVVGSTAAGLAHFWSEVENDVGGAVADARLEEVLQSHSAQVSETEPLEQHPAATNSDQAVALVQYAHPDQHGFLEFLAAEELKRRYPAAVAWRIDGESMTPRYQDGDLVITSPDHPALEMHPCVARQSGQIGVNCKLFQTIGEDVLLIPINDSQQFQRFPRTQLAWAWRVLASVRLQ